jgi:hypothetical protein
MASQFERAQENQRFVALALEASVYLKGRDHGLTLPELTEIGLPLNFRKGGISDAVAALEKSLARVDDVVRLSHGPWEFILFGLGAFVPYDYRPAHADLDFPMQYLLSLVDERGAADAHATRDEIIQAAKGSDAARIDVAIEMLILAYYLEPRAAGGLSLTQSSNSLPLPSAAFASSKMNRPDMPAVYEAVRALLDARRRTPRPAALGPSRGSAAGARKGADLTVGAVAPPAAARTSPNVASATRIVLRCLVISPGDVAEEREAVTQGIIDFNARFGASFGVIVEPVRWETHGTPRMGGAPQTILNGQIVDGCDLAIAVFWTRIGSPTETHPSGSAEEVARLVTKGVPVSVYFSDRPLGPSQIDAGQLSKLRDLRADYQKRGLLGTFESVEQLRGLVPNHLAGHVAALVPAATGVGAARHGFVAAPLPDVRVTVDVVSMVAAATNVAPSLEVKRSTVFVRVRVDNHSPDSVFLTGPSFALGDGSWAMSERDSTGALAAEKRELRSADSTQYLYAIDSVETLLSGSPAGEVVVHDAIQRRFRAPHGALATALAAAKAKT